MALTYELDPEHRIVTILGDYAQPGEWRRLLTELRQDPAFTPGYAVLRDVRRSENPVSVETVIGILAVVREMWGTLGVRRAAILTRPGMNTSAAVAHALAQDDQLPIGAFDSEADAVSWLLQTS